MPCWRKNCFKILPSNSKHQWLLANDSATSSTDIPSETARSGSSILCGTGTGSRACVRFCAIVLSCPGMKQRNNRMPVGHRYEIHR